MFLVIIATILLAFDFALQKLYQAKEGANITSGLKFNAVTGLLMTVIFFVLLGCKLEFSWFSVIMAFAMALFITSYSIIGFRVLKNAGMAIYSIFLMSGGMLLPYFYGVLFLQEELNIFRIVGIIAILVAVILSNKSKCRIKISVLPLCVAVFILNGFVSIVSKTHQIGQQFHAVSSTAFVMYSGIARCLFSMIALLFCKDKKQAFSFSTKNTLLILGGSALIGGVSYMFQLIGATNLPASVLYPVVTGGSIIFSALSGKFFFKESFSRYQLLGIALCFVGTLLFL